jgi:hypothetical protein
MPRKPKPVLGTISPSDFTALVDGTTPDGTPLVNPENGRERRVTQIPKQVLPDGTVVYKGKRGRPRKPKGMYSHSGREHYPLAAKVDAVTCWTVIGNIRTVSEVLGINYETLKAWKSEVWWDDLAKAIRQEKQEELDGTMTGIIDKSLKILQDRLDNGDVIINAKTGRIIRADANIATTVNVLKNVFDKRQLIRNEPTSISRQESTDERLQRLAEEFAVFSKAKTIEHK